MTMLPLTVRVSLFASIPQNDGPVDSEDSSRGKIHLEIKKNTKASMANDMWCFFFSALERKLNEAETEKFNIKQMKDLFEQKAAQLATEIVG